MNCIFCKIASKEQSAEIVYENGSVIAFRDIKPKAPVHVLIVPKHHIESVNDIDMSNSNVFIDILLASKEIAKEQKVDDGYRLVFNVGRKGGQVVDHVHLHLLGGF